MKKRKKYVRKQRKIDKKRVPWWLFLVIITFFSVLFIVVIKSNKENVVNYIPNEMTLEKKQKISDLSDPNEKLDMENNRKTSERLDSV